LIVRALSPVVVSHAAITALWFCLIVAVEVATDDGYEAVTGPVVENVITPEPEVLDEDVAAYELFFAPLGYVIVTVNVLPVVDSRTEQLSESSLNVAVPVDDVTFGLPPEQPEPLSVTFAVSVVPVADSVKGGVNLICPVSLLQL
jgi:hypothetical protein